MPAVCEAYGAHYVECGIGKDPTYAAYYCTYALGLGARYADCVAAAEDLYACLSTADCTALSRGSACPTELEAVTTACGLGGSSGGAGTSSGG
ncbi:MAG: hypothetical protein IPH07_39550 [Deltaproteobacteria bacterium]|nr:hypothetical protein [Deltaproteobacteria bacterium]MBK8241563.1 hypothetical protein [Deltaproteobacteria bacterium]MBK8713930.1 hypothetical protein [Deltaproteobacteria bacterium]MBP7289851.1 hypothetical protein [Nannocystaceae bacterium]